MGGGADVFVSCTQADGELPHMVGKGVFARMGGVAPGRAARELAASTRWCDTEGDRAAAMAGLTPDITDVVAVRHGVLARIHRSTGW
jgi:hypothetical protein